MGLMIQEQFLSLSYTITGQMSDFIHHRLILQSLVFLINSRYPLFCIHFNFL